MVNLSKTLFFIRLKETYYAYNTLSSVYNRQVHILRRFRNIVRLHSIHVLNLLFVEKLSVFLIIQLSYLLDIFKNYLLRITFSYYMMFFWMNVMIFCKFLGVMYKRILQQCVSYIFISLQI